MCIRDSFYPVQDAAIAALNGPFDGVERQQEEYAARNRALCGGLRSIGWNVPDSKGTMFVWAPIPASYTSSEKFTLDLMEKSGVIVVPVSYTHLSTGGAGRETASVWPLLSVVSCSMAPEGSPV